MQAVLYGFPSVPLESEDMAASDRVNIENRLTALETKATIAMWCLGFLIPGLLVWGSYITVNVVSATGGVSARLVKQLEAPKSQAQLQADLSTVIAQVQTAKANGVKPDERKVRAVSKALSAVVQREPEEPQAWEAAADLISYRASAINLNPTIDCRSEMSYDVPSTPGTVAALDWISLHDCTLNLDDLGAWIHKIDPLAIGAGFTCVRVRVVYRGTPLPAISLQLINCTFDFQLRQAPGPHGEELVRSLLAANDLNSVSLSEKEPS